MNRLFRLRTLIPIIVIVLLCLGGIWFLTQTADYRVNFTNAHNVRIVNSSNKTVATINKTGDSIRLITNSEYRVIYSGNNGFSDGETIFNSKHIASISPYYSSSHLDALLSQEKEAIHSVLIGAYPQIANLYSFSSEHLYHFGDWYGVKLTYNGEYGQNTDDLHVIMQKQNNQWVVNSEPWPYLTIYNTPKRTPLDIIHAVNSL